jgi:hypothetical protein
MGKGQHQRVLGWVVQNSVSTILALNQLDLTEGFNAKLVTKFLLNNRALVFVTIRVTII